ncbi:hypothetical protein N9W89_06755 [Hellea sp.]|nr:hypothetical protein [Hellea sp.]
MSEKLLSFDRTVTYGLMLSVMLQTASALIWAGAAEARIKTLEAQMAMAPGVAQRLARVEGQTTVMTQSLTRIERKLDR